MALTWLLQKKKSIAMVYPSVDKGVLSMNQILLTKMEEENPSLIEVGGQGKIFLNEFKKRIYVLIAKAQYLYVKKVIQNSNCIKLIYLEILRV